MCPSVPGTQAGASISRPTGGLPSSSSAAGAGMLTWRAQNAAFKDFVTLATQRTSRRRYLYLAGTEQAVTFFRGGRALDSVLNTSQMLGRLFREHYGHLFNTVGEYYGVHGGEVEIVDVSPWVPELMVD